MKRHLIYYILLAGCLLGGLSSCSIKARIKKADKKFSIGEYYDAAEIYKQCYGRVSSKTEKDLKAHVAFYQAECYRVLNNSKSVNCYQNAVRYKYQDSIVYLHYAQALMYQGKYKDAEKNYAIYLEKHPDDYVAQAGQYACQQIPEWKKETSRYKIANAKEFNSKRTSNFAPAYIGQGGDALMFTSNRQEQNSGSKKKMKRPSPVTGAQSFNLYSARKDAAGKWQDIQLAEGLYGESEEGENENDSTANKTGTAEMGVCCFTADGKTMYFTFSCPVNGQDLGAKIFTSSRASGEWAEPQEVKIFNDSTITIGHPSICLTGDTMYFVSDAPGGYGGKDIWMAELDGSNWLNPQNLGPRINTSADEMYPCIHPDGSLYFASNGHSGYGGLDIFKAERDTLAEAVDSIPVAWLVYNMGAPFNTNGDDFGITFEGNSQNGYFSSNRGQKKGYDEIYRFVLPEMEFLIEGIVVDNNNDPIADAKLRLVGNDGTNSKMTARRDGTFKTKINKDAKYVLLASARGYLNQSATLNTYDLKDSKTYEQKFTLAPISKPVTMDNIFYEFGKWDLTPSSEAGLQSLIKLLNDNPNITIELSAHTDFVGDSVRNTTLSEKRAESVVNYLIKSGIEKERLTPVGYGESKPVVADAAINKKYPFIPIGQVLDEPFILGLTPQQQETCHQINRRTEFKVLKTTYKLY